jgi:dihydrofolate reductase
MKTQYYTATSLDGFLADRHNSLDWLMQFGDEMTSDYPDFIKDVGALVMGSTTYQWVLDHHVRPGTEKEQPWLYSQPTWVMTSRALPAVKGADIRFARGDVRAVHEAMAAAANGKNLWVVGGGELVGQFHDHGLLDEVWVQYAPVALGDGAPLLPRRVELELREVDRNRDFGCLRYDVVRSDRA